jgi:hypothetical protein
MENDFSAYSIEAPIAFNDGDVSYMNYYFEWFCGNVLLTKGSTFVTARDAQSLAALQADISREVRALQKVKGQLEEMIAGLTTLSLENEKYVSEISTPPED